MSRLLVVISILSVVFLGCGSDSNGPAGSGGDGGSAGTGGVAGDACLDDLTVLGSIGTGEDIASLVTDRCVLGDRNCVFTEVVPCIAECLEEEVGLPQDCGACIGLITECILQECISDCTDPESPDCAVCIEAAGAECNPLFEPCAGFPVQ